MVDRPLDDMTTVERIEDLEGFRRIREAWDDLLADSDADVPFLTWEWLYTWWTHLSLGRRLCILAVRRGGTLVAIAPLAARRRGLSGLLTLPTLEFLGTGHVGSDYLDLIVRRGHEAIATQALAEHLDRGDLALELGQLRKDGCAARELAGRLRLRGWRLSDQAADVCPYARLAGHTWGSYLEGLGSSHRYNFRRRLRNLSKRFEVRMERATSPGERHQALELLIAMHNQRWSERGGSNALHTPSLVAFHREIVGRSSERGWLRLLVLWLDDRPVASLYGFMYRRVFYFYQAGFDLEHRKDSVGLVTMGLAVKSAIEEGAEEFDMLHGSEEYKFRWTREVRALEKLDLYPPHARGALSRGAVELGRNARRLARRLLPRALPARIRHGGDGAA